MKDIVVFGVGGMGREVLFELREINRQSEQYNILGFADDNKPVGEYVDGIRVLGGTEWLASYEKPLCVAVAIGNPVVRRKIYDSIRFNPELSFPNIIAPNVIMSESVRLGEGCIICFSCVLTVNITLGSFVLIGNGCAIGHDSVLDDFATLYPGVNVSGNVRIRELAEIGVGTKIIQGKTIGKNSVLGAGTVVIRDIPEFSTAVGVPAKVIKSHQNI